MNTQSKESTYKRFRPAALIIEGIPLTLMVGGLLLNINELKIIGFMTAAFMYMSASFYLFKAEKFKALDVIVASIGGLMFAVILIGILFDLLDWPSGPEMVTISKFTLNYGLLLSIIYMLARNLKAERRQFEFTMSQKLALRFLILTLLFYVTGLHQSLVVPI
ncbi:MAG: hypothetical protein AAF927_04830 [Bacteroidota bacterium]